MDFLGLLAQDGAVLNWVQFRAHILGRAHGGISRRRAGGRGPR